jgi:hypothetical protein
MYYVMRWRSGQLVGDWWDPGSPIGYPTREQAEARVRELENYHFKRTGKPLRPRPQIIDDLPPLWKKRRKTMVRPAEVDALPNGDATLPEALPARKIKAVSR